MLRPQYSDFCVVALAEGPCLVHSITGDLLRALEAPELFQRPRVISVSSEGHCIICYERGRFCNFSINGKLLAQMEVKDSTRVRWQHTKRDGAKPFVGLLATLYALFSTFRPLSWAVMATTWSQVVITVWWRCGRPVTSNSSTSTLAVMQASGPWTCHMTKGQSSMSRV